MLGPEHPELCAGADVAVRAPHVPRLVSGQCRALAGLSPVEDPVSRRGGGGVLPAHEQMELVEGRTQLQRGVLDGRGGGR